VCFNGNRYFYRSRSKTQTQEKLKAIQSLALFGAGNVAQHLSKALHSKGVSFTQVFSRNLEHAQNLAKELKAEATDKAENVRPIDAFLFSLSDDAYSSVLEKVQASESLLIHTSGNLGLDLFEGHSQRRGVFYPFQTLSDGQKIDMKTVPLFIESNTTADLQSIEKLAKKISQNVHRISDDDRRSYHLAGVFTNNFVNHMYFHAKQICEREGLSFELLEPLMRETLSKVIALGPRQAQTGPARRADEKVLNRHYAQLEDHSDTQKLYQTLSESIIKEYLNE